MSEKERVDTSGLIESASSKYADLLRSGNQEKIEATKLGIRAAVLTQAVTSLNVGNSTGRLKNKPFHSASLEGARGALATTMQEFYLGLADHGQRYSDNFQAAREELEELFLQCNANVFVERLNEKMSQTSE
jgi:hypothetical protein